jgi:hypothetical protein
VMVDAVRHGDCREKDGPGPHGSGAQRANGE